MKWFYYYLHLTPDKLRLDEVTCLVYAYQTVSGKARIQIQFGLIPQSTTTSILVTWSAYVVGIDRPPNSE
jgi:hypothetical protein